MKFLLVSDSKDLAQTIPLILKVRWPELSLIHVTEAGEAVNLIHREQPDLVILHLNSTLVDCFDLIAQIRGFSDVSLVVFSDSNDVVDKVRALEMGAVTILLSLICLWSLSPGLMLFFAAAPPTMAVPSLSLMASYP